MEIKIKRPLSLVLALIITMSVTSCVVTDISDIDGDTSGDIKDVVTTGDKATKATDTNPEGSNNGGTASNTNATIEEKVCFEYDGLVVTAKEIVDHTIWGAGIKIHVENNSSKDYSIGVEQAIVNNCMITDLFTCSVAAGKKANDTIYLSSSDLRESGISNIGQVELYFYVYDPATYERIYETDCVTIKTSDYNVMDTTVNNAGYTLYDENGIKIVGKYVDEYKLLGKAIVLHISNNSDKNIGISCDDMSINGYMVTPLFSSTIYAGKFAIDEITILSSDLEANNIKEISNFALKFRIHDAETYQTIIETDELSFSAK